MNMSATINAIILRRGGADKMTFKRFNQIALCLSYPSTLKVQSELRKGNLAIVKERTLNVNAGDSSKAVEMQVVPTASCPEKHVFSQSNDSELVLKSITKITKLSTSPQEISNAIPIFVKSCDQNVSSFWSHDFLFLSFGIFEFRYININITTLKDCVAVNSKITRLICCCNFSTFR